MMLNIGQNTTIPNTISISWLARYRLYRILQTPHSAYTLIDHAGMTIPLPNEGTQNHFQYPLFPIIIIFNKNDRIQELTTTHRVSSHMNHPDIGKSNPE